MLEAVVLSGSFLISSCSSQRQWSFIVLDMARVKNVGGGPGDDDGDRPRPPPLAREKGK